MKTPITDGEVEALETGLKTVLSSFKSLADFKTQHSRKLQLLQELPIDEAQVSKMQAEMP